MLTQTHAIGKVMETGSRRILTRGENRKHILDELS